jgi:hypothetical protein
VSALSLVEDNSRMIVLYGISTATPLKRAWLADHGPVHQPYDFKV